MHVEVGWGAEDTVAQGAAVLGIGIGGLELKRCCIGLSSQQLTVGEMRGDYQTARGHPYSTQKHTSSHRPCRPHFDPVVCHSFLRMRALPPQKWRSIRQTSSLASPPMPAPTQ